MKKNQTKGRRATRAEGFGGVETLRKSVYIAERRKDIRYKLFMC